MRTEELAALNAKGRVYTVREIGTNEHYGNHTYSEACARAHAMRRNWQYKKNFEVIEGRG